MNVTVEYWRCFRGGSGLVLYLLVSGHDVGRRYKIEADLQHKGKPVDVVLAATSKLDESPASLEVEIPTEGLPSGRYDVSVTFDGERIGTYPCAVGQLAET